ncbi:MAG: hypothetical protein U1E43_04955 [Rhodospirillales bacterium]
MMATGHAERDSGMARDHLISELIAGRTYGQGALALDAGTTARRAAVPSAFSEPSAAAPAPMATATPQRR